MSILSFPGLFEVLTDNCMIIGLVTVVFLFIDYSTYKIFSSTSESKVESIEDLVEVEGPVDELEGFIEPEEFMGVPVMMEDNLEEESESEPVYYAMSIRELRAWIYTEGLAESVKLITNKNLGKLKLGEMRAALDVHYGLSSIESEGLVLI